MIAYCCCLLGALLAAMGLLALRRGPRLALPALVLGGVLGVLLAKVLYFVLMLPYVWPRWGFATLLRTDPATFSFFGLCLGLCLGVALAARLTGSAAAQTMDGFAPVLAAFVALARMGEYFLGVQGSGSYVENEARELGYIREGEIIFAFSDPDALKGYTEEEYQIILEEMRE